MIGHEHKRLFPCCQTEQTSEPRAGGAEPVVVSYDRTRRELQPHTEHRVSGAKGRWIVRARADIGCWAVFSIFLVSMPALAQTDVAKPPKTDSPTIALKTTKSERVAFRDHRGPYWTIGPEFTRLHQYLTEQNLPGPMFARFLNEPGTVPIDGLRTEIGFFLTDQFQPHSSFQTHVRRPELVAFMLFDGPSVARSRDLARLREWIREQGYTAFGPITEIYHVHTADVEREVWRTEIQMPIARFRPPQVLRKVPGNTRGDPSDAMTDKKNQQPDGETSRMVAKRQSHPPPERSTAMRPDRRPEKSGTKSDSIPENRPRPDRQRDVSPPNLTVGEDRRSASPPSASDLIELRRFDELAEALMPDEFDSANGDGVWRGQIALRVVAVARGLVQMYPATADWAGELADAITQRFDTFAKKLPVDPREQATVTYSSQPKLLETRKRAIMRELDRLMGHVAARALDANTARATLTEIVQRVLDLDSPHFMEVDQHDIPTP